MESEAAHAGRILRLRAARNTNPARCRGDGRRRSTAALPGRRNGDGLLAANAMLVIGDRSRTRRAARHQLNTWHAAGTRRGWKPAIWWNEARMPTGQVLQLSCGVTPNVMSEPNGAKFCAIWGLNPERVRVLHQLTSNSGPRSCTREQVIERSLASRRRRAIDPLSLRAPAAARARPGQATGSVQTLQHPDGIAQPDGVRRDGRPRGL